MRGELALPQHVNLTAAAPAVSQQQYTVLFDVVGAFHSGWGGVEEHICTLGRYLHNQGIAPLLLARVAYEAEKLQRFVDSSIRVVVHPDLRVGNAVYASRWRRIFALREVLIREDVDVYHIHSIQQGNEVWSALAARSAGIASIVCTYHNQIQPWGHIPRRRLGAFAMHRALGVTGIGVSHDVCQTVQRWYRPQRDGVAHIVYGIDDLAEMTVPPHMSGRNHVHIGFIGRLDHQKGVDTLLTALSLIDPQLPFRVTMIGDGDQRDELKQQACDLGLTDRLTFQGWVFDASERMREFDLLVMPSRYEGLPIVAVEACRAGIPVVATRAGGLAEVIRNGENGWVVPIDDPAALAAAISTAVQDADLRHCRGRVGRILFEKYYRAETMVGRTRSLYERDLRV